VQRLLYKRIAPVAAGFVEEIRHSTEKMRLHKLPAWYTVLSH